MTIADVERIMTAHRPRLRSADDRRCAAVADVPQQTAHEPDLPRRFQEDLRDGPSQVEPSKEAPSQHVQSLRADEIARARAERVRHRLLPWGRPVQGHALSSGQRTQHLREGLQIVCVRMI